MEKPQYKTVSLRLTEEEYRKLYQIAQVEGRFVSRQARYWLRQCIREYEASKDQQKPA